MSAPPPRAARILLLASSNGIATSFSKVLLTQFFRANWNARPIPAIKRLSFLALFLLGTPLLTSAQDDTITLDDLVQSAERWAKENLDENALRVLQKADQEKINQLFKDIHKDFHGEYVIDLAALKDTARAVLPLLESYEETQPYAAWLKTRLDYLEVADQLRLIIPPPKPVPGEPPKVLPNPQPQTAREIWIKKVAERPWPKSAKSYVSRLKPVFIAEKVPSQLVWIAEVESSFDPRARSPEGAAGLFQLMPDTAKRYGLRTAPFDQRLKPDLSARAAAKYLRYLHAHFKDWRLAIAAYNAGEGTVDNLLKGRKVRTFDAIATRLPAETQMYVPKVEAVLLRREGLKFQDL
jgi:membrane-bound lytic murein transglycosylase D